MKCIDPSARLGYSALGCQCRLNKGGSLFRRTRYQQGSLVREERKKESATTCAQQSPCDHQVSSSNAGEQTPGTREIGRCYSAGRLAIGEQINTDSIVGVGALHYFT